MIPTKVVYCGESSNIIKTSDLSLFEDFLLSVVVTTYLINLKYLYNLKKPVISIIKNVQNQLDAPADFFVKTKEENI